MGVGNQDKGSCIRGSDRIGPLLFAILGNPPCSIFTKMLASLPGTFSSSSKGCSPLVPQPLHPPLSPASLVSGLTVLALCFDFLDSSCSLFFFPDSKVQAVWWPVSPSQSLTHNRDRYMLSVRDRENRPCLARLQEITSRQPWHRSLQRRRFPVTPTKGHTSAC